LNSRGRDNVSVSAESLQAVYSSQGKLAEVLAERKCQFRTDDFQGLARSLNYDASSGEINIFGQNSTIDSGKNRFESSHFRMRTGSKSITSRKGVKATIIPGRKSALLGAKPVFVTADAMETSQKGGASRFTGKVNLFQGEVEMHAGELQIDGPGGAITCTGGADLRFRDNGEPLDLKGKTVSFDPDSSRLVVEGEARLEQGNNSLAANRIELVFGADDRLQDIFASGAASFRRKDIEGRCQVLHWQYARQSVVFREQAEISRRAAGTTRGEELHLDLASNRIIVTGSKDRSETTIGDPRP
jgi:lipopolysaccharide transport protein LptA